MEARPTAGASKLGLRPAHLHHPAGSRRTAGTYTSSLSFETSTPMNTDFMLYYPCLEVEPGDLDDSRSTCATVEPLDETRRRVVLAPRVETLGPNEPRRHRPAEDGRSRRAVLSGHLSREQGIVYQKKFRQGPFVGRHGLGDAKRAADGRTKSVHRKPPTASLKPYHKGLV